MHDEALTMLPALLSALNVERPLLFGHSDGASIALIFAGSGLMPLAGLILEAPHVFVEPVTLRSIAAIRDAFEHSDLKTRLMQHHGANNESMFRGWADIWLSPEFLAWNITPSLQDIECPVLVIQGENDQYGTVDQVNAIRRAVHGRCETLILPACGHAPHVDRQAATLEAAAQFVARAGLDRDA
jgi:pimeloyl-ACP methyl ester carboxylesterase